MYLSRTKTTTYNVGQMFKVDVVETHEEFQAWLYRSDMGIKDLMFGVPKKTTEKEFLEMVERNVEDYKKDYEMEYC